jgi:hypothetical protein
MRVVITGDRHWYAPDLAVQVVNRSASGGAHLEPRPDGTALLAPVNAAPRASLSDRRGVLLRGAETKSNTTWWIW